PLGLLLHALPAPVWLETSALGMLAVRLLSPAGQKKRWLLMGAAGLMWGVLAILGTEWIPALRVGVMAAALIFVGAPWYTWNWISLLLLPAALLLGLLLMSFSFAPVQAWIQIAVGVPLL